MINCIDQKIEGINSINQLDDLEIDNVGGAWVGPALVVVAVVAIAYYAGRENACGD
jgi:hypothetical protein